MSRFNKQGMSTGISVARESIDTLIKGQGSELTNNALTASLVSLESADANQVSDLEHGFESALSNIESNLKATLGDNVVISSIGLEAAAIVAMGLGNPTAYAEAATNITKSDNLIQFNSIGSAGAIDSRLNVANEAFDERDLSQYAATSIVFNALAAAQDEFNECFFPTYVMTPDQTGLEVKVERTMVLNEVRRDIKGSVTDFGKVNLVDALQDASILENDVTKVTPIYLADDSRADLFVDTDVMSTREVEIDGVAQNTSAIRISAMVDLLALSVGIGGVNSQILDSTDSLHSRVGISAVYVRARNSANVADASAGESAVLRVDVSNFPRAHFVPSVEGDSNEMTLTFKSDAILLDGVTTDIEGTNPAVLSPLASASNTLRVAVNLTGTVNIETGALEVNASPVRAVSMTSELGEAVPLKGAEATAITDELVLDVIGYDVSAYKSNANRRTRGLLIDRTEITERYMIPLGSPISAPKPIHNSSDSASDLRSLITTSRTRTTNNGVTTLLNYADKLKATVSRIKETGVVPNIEGIGRYLIKPFFVEIDLDIEAEINSTKTHEKAEDVSALIVDVIRDLSYRMNRDSNYQAALDMETAGTQSKPMLAIGTDHVLARHIMVSGDERTASIGMDYKVVTTPDGRMDDKIVLTFTRGNTGKPDPLSFGTHAYMPELTSTATVSRDNATTKETQIQPRNLHVPHLPVMAVINVKNLQKVLQSRVDR